MKIINSGDEGWAALCGLDPLVFGDMPPAPEEEEMLLLEVMLRDGSTRRDRVKAGGIYEWRKSLPYRPEYHVIDDLMPGSEEGGSTWVCACGECEKQEAEMAGIMRQEVSQLRRWQSEAAEVSLLPGITVMLLQ